MDSEVIEEILEIASVANESYLPADLCFPKNHCAPYFDTLWHFKCNSGLTSTGSGTKIHRYFRGFVFFLK